MWMAWSERANSLPNTGLGAREAVLNGRLPVVRGVALPEDDRLRRTIIERLMCKFSVDLDEITLEFQYLPLNFRSDIDAIDELAQDGLVIRDGLTLTTPDEGRAL